MEEINQRLEKAKSVSELSDKEILEEMARLRKALSWMRPLVQELCDEMIALGKERKKRDIDRFEREGLIEHVVLDVLGEARGKKWTRA